MHTSMFDKLFWLLQAYEYITTWYSKFRDLSRKYGQKSLWKIKFLCKYLINYQHIKWTKV